MLLKEFQSESAAERYSFIYLCFLLLFISSHKDFYWCKHESGGLVIEKPASIKKKAVGLWGSINQIKLIADIYQTGICWVWKMGLCFKLYAMSLLRHCEWFCQCTVIYLCFSVDTAHTDGKRFTIIIKTQITFICIINMFASYIIFTRYSVQAWAALDV